MNWKCRTCLFPAGGAQRLGEKAHHLRPAHPRGRVQRHSSSHSGEKPETGASGTLEGLQSLLCGSELIVGKHGHSVWKTECRGSDWAPWGWTAPGKRDMVPMMDSKEAGHLAQTVAFGLPGSETDRKPVGSLLICVSREVLGQANKV